MNVVVTGVAGFVGPALARRLVEAGCRVVGIDDLPYGKVEAVPPEVDFIRGDVADMRVLQRLPSGVSTVFHLAGQSSGEVSFDDPVGDLHRNVVTTLWLVEWCANHGAPRLAGSESHAGFATRVRRVPPGDEAPARRPGRPR